MAGGSITYTTEEQKKLFQDVLDGRVHLFALPTVLYRRIAEELTTTVYDAFNLDLETNLQNPDFATPRALKRNLYDFSAAKTFQQVKDMQNFIFNEKGFRRSFSEFEKKAKTIFDTYNRNWLEAEFETATRLAESSNDWEQYTSEADVFPLLRYNSLEDEKVRDEHRPLNGVVKPVNDPFWNTYMPPNGWRCRCFVEQLEEDEAPVTQDPPKPKLNKVFAFNVGKKKEVFARSGANMHPYFDVKSRFRRHKENNFGLPLPPDIRDIKPKTVGKQKVEVVKESPTPEKGFKASEVKAVGVKNLNDKAAAILNGQDGAAEIVKEFETDINFRTPKESTTANAFEFQEKTKGKTVSIISGKSKGNCAVNNSFLNIKVKKGENLNFERVDMGASVEEVLNKNKKLRKVTLRNGSEIITDTKEKAQRVNIIGTVQKNGKIKFWGVSSASSISSKSVATTYTHELAHLIHNKHDKGTRRTILVNKASEKGIKLSDSITEYGESNWSEFWAEQFTVYVHANSYMLNEHKKIFDFFEEMLEVYGVDKKTITLAK